MAWVFGDSFDLYSVVADAALGFWDSATSPASWTLVAGRFTSSLAIRQPNSAANLVKASAVNDMVHHISLAFRQTYAVTGTTLTTVITFRDGTTAQCSIVFRSDGAILLTSGLGGGTVLATYTGAITAANVWNQFEIEVVIHNTTGSITVRKNGNTSNDFNLGSLNTRAGTANNYANSIALGEQTSTANADVDDFLWRSDATSVAWVGDIRCYLRSPASNVSTQFTAAPSPMFAQGSATGSTGAMATNQIVWVGVTAPASGTLASLYFNLSATITGHMKAALYDSTGAGGIPGNLLATGAELAGPAVGPNVFAVTGGPSIVDGTVYYVALWSDTARTGIGQIAGVYSATSTYTGTFPSSAPALTFASAAGFSSAGMNVTSLLNFSQVNETISDGLGSYVYDSTVGHADFYTVSTSPTPTSVVAVTTRGLMQKSDAGTRTASIRLKSGAVTVATPTLSLSSNFQWAWRTDVNDPNTGSAWAASAVDAINVGPLVVS